MDSDTQPELQVGQSVRERFEAGEIFVPFPSLTWMDICGEDRARVLGNLTTNNVRSLAVGQGLETFVTDARGKTFAHALVYAMEDRLRLVTVPDQYERIANHIDRYVVREDVRFENASDLLYTVFWPGVDGARLALRLGLACSGVPRLATQQQQWEGLDVFAMQVPWTRWTDWLLVVDRSAADQLESQLVTDDILPGSESIVHCGRIANKFPWFGADCLPDNLPQEMDRDALAIDFRKGCYLGQETIARLDALGQVQKKLALWRFDSEQVPAVGMELRAGEKVVATVTSGTYCFDHGAPLALCMTRRGYFDPGAKAESPIGAAEVIKGDD